MTSTRILLVGVLMAAMSLLTACSSPQPARTVTAAPLPAVTVTATATPDAADPLGPLGAWSVCYSFLTRYASRLDTSFVIPQLRTYDPKWITPVEAGLQVRISPADLPGDWTCVVAGTAGAPQILTWTTDN